VAKEKILTEEQGNVKLEFPDIDENGFRRIMSLENEVVYVRQIEGGCEKKVNDTITFIPGAYIREWTRNGVAYRYELMGG
jgi:hypothetical protein